MGFVTAFPHITKIFRYAPEVETVVDVRKLDTATLNEVDCNRDDQYHELACYAESLIVADEYRAWASNSASAVILPGSSPRSRWLGFLNAYRTTPCSAETLSGFRLPNFAAR